MNTSMIRYDDVMHHPVQVDRIFAKVEVREYVVFITSTQCLLLTPTHHR